MKKQKMPALLSAAALALNTFAVFPAYVSAAEYSDATISMGSVFSDTVEITDSESWFNFSDSNGGDCPSIFDMDNVSDIAAKIKEKTGDTPDEDSIKVTDITLTYSLTAKGNVTGMGGYVSGGYQDSSWNWHDLEQKDLDISGSSVNADTIWASENTDNYRSLWCDFGGSGEEGSSVSLEITDLTLDVSYLPLKNMNVTGTGTFEASIDNVPWEYGTKSVMADSNEDNDGIYNAWTCLAYYTDYDDLTTIEEFTSKYNKITASFTALDVKSDLRAKVIIQTMSGTAFSVGEFSVTEGKNTLTAELTNDLAYGESEIMAIGVSFFSDTETTFTICGENGVIISGTKTLSGNYFNDAELNLASGEYGISNNTACLNASWQGDFPASISIKDFAEQYGSVDLSFMASDISSNYGDIVYKVGFFTDKNTVFLNDEPFTLKEGLNTVKMDLSGKILGDATANASQFMVHFYVPVEDGDEWSVPEGVAMGETFASFKMTAVPVSVTGTDTLTFLPEADTINAVVGGNAWGNWIEENGIVYDKEEGTMPEDFPANFTELAAKYGTYSAKMTVENLTVADGFKLCGRFFIVEDVGYGVARYVGDSFDIKEGVNDISVELSQIPAAGNIRSFGISVETDPSDVNSLEIGSTAFSFDYSFAENKPEPVKPQIIKAVAGDGEVTLTWTPTEGAENYAIYTYLNKKWTLSDTSEETTFTVTGLTNGVKYGFAIKAYVDGDWTEVTSADIVYATPEGAAKPVITKTVPGDGQVAVNWTEVKGAKNYAVYTYLNKKWTLAGTTTALGKYVKGLTNGVKYGFAVKAYVNGKWTTVTSEDIVYATPTGAAKPVITKAVAGDKQVALNWTTVTGAGKYAVYTYLNGKWTLVGTRTTNGMYVKNLTNGVKYGFAVKAYINGAWTTVTSKDVVYATPSAPASEEKPVITKAQAGNGQVALNWTAVNGAANYAVYTYVNGEWTLMGTRTATGMYVKGLTNGVKYGFAVKAYVNGKWTTVTSKDVVYATPTAAKAELIDDMTDIEFTSIQPDLKF